MSNAQLTKTVHSILSQFARQEHVVRHVLQMQIAMTTRTKNTVKEESASNVQESTIIADLTPLQDVPVSSAQLVTLTQTVRITEMPQDAIFRVLVRNVLGTRIVWTR